RPATKFTFSRSIVATPGHQDPMVVAPDTHIAAARAAVIRIAIAPAPERPGAPTPTTPAAAKMTTMEMAKAAMAMMLGQGWSRRDGERAGNQRCDCEKFHELRHRSTSDAPMH